MFIDKIILINAVLLVLGLVLKLLIAKHLTPYERLTGFHEGFQRLVREKNKKAIMLNIVMFFWVVSTLIIGGYLLF